MRTTLGAALLAGLVITVAPVSGAHAAPDTGATGGYIVVLRDTASPSAVSAAHAQTHGVSVSHVYQHALRGYAAKMSATAAARIAKDSRVLFVQPDGVVTATAQTMPTGIDRIDAELSPTANIDGVDDRVDVDVAVIDTGIDLDHPDLNVYTAGAKNCSTGRNADDGNGHGTHVAGTIGALDNGDGVVGVAPGARVWPVRVLDNRGSGSWSDVICGIDYVTAHADEIEVANMSLGGSGSDSTCGSNTDAMHEAICNSVAAGVTYVVAAGNSAANAATFVPATYDEVITVSALADFNGLPGGGASPTCRSDVDDTIADFSNYGADVDLMAPGVCILSTWKGGGYNTISGTSMASPHAAGGAALYKATHPTASPATVKSALQAAGTTDYLWPAGDPDGIQEKLLNVAGF
ncbi:MAG TPA: S8 family serine peptidase [Micromonosporaceae bacterium]